MKDSIPRISTLRVATSHERTLALEVLAATYCDEKGWVTDPRGQFPEDDLGRADLAWFMVCDGEQPVGVLRVLYDPPLHVYRDYDLRWLDPQMDVEALLGANRVAEIGRFAVLPGRRRHHFIAVALLRAAIMDTVRRGYSHYVTDVFEGEVNSPYEFHTRVLGFRPVATHSDGELLCTNRRITLVLDLRECYQRLRSDNGLFYRMMTAGWDTALHETLQQAPAEGLQDHHAEPRDATALFA